MTGCEPQAGLFHTSAEHYLRYRSTYPVSLVERVAQLCRLHAVSRVLDLGSGPGILAHAFAPLCGSVTCVDAEPEMIAIARRHLDRFGSRIGFLCASSENLTTQIGTFRIVVIGRAFHWMDRAVTLDLLDKIVEPTGAVVLFQDPLLKLPENSWRADFDKVRIAFAATESARHGAAKLPTAENEAYLLKSSFCQLERISKVVSRRVEINELIGRALSMPGTSPQDLNSAQPQFEAAMQHALAPHAMEGWLSEIAEPQALIARRERQHRSPFIESQSPAIEPMRII